MSQGSPPRMEIAELFLAEYPPVYRHQRRALICSSPASHGSRIGGDGQRGHLPPRNMALVGLSAVDARPFEHMVFGASIGIPLPETLEEVHSDVLLRGVLTHSDLCLV